jgi:hypothetical protein
MKNLLKSSSQWELATFCHVKILHAKTLLMKNIQGRLKWSLDQLKLNLHHHLKWNMILKRRRKPKNNHLALNLMSKIKEIMKNPPPLKIKLKKMVMTKTSHKKNLLVMMD